MICVAWNYLPRPIERFADIRIVTNSTNRREKQENIINDKVAGKNQTAREVVRFLILYVAPLSVGTSHHCLNKRDLLESHCLANVILYHVTEFSCRLHVHHICE